MHQPQRPQEPTRLEMVETIADAVAQLREDNRCVHPNDQANEDTFVLGCIRLYMGEENTPAGHGLASLSGQIKAYASNWK